MIMDSFSQLTDDLIIRMLSFLPIKDAVATNIFSKRWLPLWRLLPRLNFEDNYREKLVLSSDFIFATLLLNRSPVLESFRLIKHSECSGLHIELWVKFAMDRFVRDLEICFDYNLYSCVIRLPSRLFRCEILETLELRNVTFLEVPSRVSFQSLKKLTLVAVRYPDEESFVRIISASHVLEKLVVESVSDDNVETFIIDVPSLRSLRVINVHQDSGPNDNRFVIHCHSLNQLEIVEEYGEVYLIGDFPELVEASLETVESKGNALESLTFAKSLSLSLDYRVQYSIGTNFFQLVRLEFCSFGENWWNLLVHVLQHSPVLQILKFECYMSIWECEETGKACWIQPSRAPECLMYHLKTFEWTDIYFETLTPVKKEVAIYILKSARRLVTATMRGSQQAFEELEFATRGSRACELTMC